MSKYQYSDLYYDLLVEYQRKSVHELLEATIGLISSNNAWIKSKNRFLLHAPTGSGKTIVTGVYIDTVFKNIDNVSFVWMCDTPSLTDQSKNKLKGMLSIPGYDYDEIKQEKQLPNHSVTYINWEKTKNSSNKARTDSESSKSIETLVQRTKEEGSVVVFVIDEAHIQTNSRKSEEFLELCSPDLILEVTATPTKPMTDYGNVCTINIEDVEETGFIKQGIIINHPKDMVDHEKKYLEKNKLKDFREYILFKSYLKRNELELLVEQYAKENDLKTYVPLLAIQLPNKSDDLQMEIEAFFDSKFGINRDNGLAVYTSGDYTDELDQIGKDESIKVLLFKQAIAKGWDCPRASLLTFIRDPRTKNFTIQTIGRIMRMPYLQVFQPLKYDALNYGYIYIEDSTNKVLKEIEVKAAEEGFKTTTYLKEEVKESCILKLKKKVWEEEDNEGEIKEVIKGEFGKKDWMSKLDKNKPLEKKILSDAKSTLSLYKEREIELQTKEISDLTKYDIQTMYDKLSNQFPLNKDIMKKIEEKLRHTYDERKRQEIILANVNSIKTEALSIYLHEKKKCISHPKYENWQVPQTLSLNAKVNIEQREFVKKYLYEKCHLKENKLEKEMAVYLHENEHVLCWLKNGDKGTNAFSLTYELNNTKHLFYPDFIAETKERIYILETKGKLNEQETAEKSKVLRDYVQNQKMLYGVKFKEIVGGIVKQQNNEFYLYQGTNFERQYDGLEESNWISLDIK